jgi:hypothetical protein
MTEQDRQSPRPHTTSDSLARLLAEHGELMAGRAIQSLLKYPSDRTFRRAVAAGTLPVQVFRLPGRVGWFARTDQVGAWLEKLGSAAPEDAVRQGGPIA